ncbi:MAG TPA: alkaline phosphatase D family protein, partial [Ramlibacter sp.]|nr:alkaline phosphatase D family protein [Ramlibacter sp.]
PMPERLLLLGDQVYADATYGLLDPVRLDDRYRLPYEALKDREVGPLADLPQDFLARIRMTPDDHEIVDNWEPAAEGTADDAYEHAMHAFWLHQRQGDPRRRRLQVLDRGPGWWLFMADTRTQRTRRTEANLDTAQILGHRQGGHLLAWLRSRPAEDLKIVTSPGMLLPRTRDCLEEPLQHDGWQGFPASLHALLAFLCEQQVRNVVFLSGDAHVGCSARITVRNVRTGTSVAFASHHTPALYAPYPFGNETRWNLLLQDRFRFAATPGAPAVYECVVDAEMVDEGRQGCGLLHASRSGAGWDLAFQVLH